MQHKGNCWCAEACTVHTSHSHWCTESGMHAYKPLQLHCCIAQIWKRQKYMIAGDAFTCIMTFVYGQMCQIYILHSCAQFLAFQIKLVNIILTKYKYNSIVIVSMLSSWHSHITPSSFRALSHKAAQAPAGFCLVFLCPPEGLITTKHWRSKGCFGIARCQTTSFY